MCIVGKIFHKLELMFANRSWESKRKYLIKCGASIGVGTRLNCNVQAFGTEPYLISVGDNCLFAQDIHLITHDGAVKVLNSLGYFGGGRMDNIAPITIGSNVYIGTGAFIMPGISIEDNCIVGANAVVTHNIPKNSVAVGVPAKVTGNIELYYKHSVEKERLFPTGGMDFKKKREYIKSILLNERN